MFRAHLSLLPNKKIKKQMGSGDMEAEALVLFADDNESFVTYLKEWAYSRGIGFVEFLRSAKEARIILGTKSVRRAILDQVFEGENDTGVDVLEYGRRRNPKMEAILLTGKYVGEVERARLAHIEGTLLDKDALTGDQMERLLASDRDFLIPNNQPNPEVDIGEVKLRLEETLDSLAFLNQTFDQLASGTITDILGELDKLKNRDKKTLYIGDRLLTIEELKHELRKRSETGLQLIRLHDMLAREPKE